MVGIFLALGRAIVDAGAAAGAIFRGDLQGVFHPFKFGQLAVRRFKGGRSTLQQFAIISLHANGGVRADKGADAALDAERFVPDRDIHSDVALLVLRGCGREGAIGRHRRDRQCVAKAGNDAAGHFLHKLRRGLGDGRGHYELAGRLGRNFDLMNVLESGVDGGVVHRHNFVARFAVTLLDRVLDLFDGQLERDNIGDFEEGRLHDDVNAGAKAKFLTKLDGVDDVELQLLVDDLLLNFLRHFVPDLAMLEGRAKEEGAALLGFGDHVVFLQEGEVVTGDKVGVIDQVGSGDRLFPEAQVRSGDGTGLLGIIDKVGLGEVFGGLTDDLDGVLVGANRTVGTEAVEHRLVGAVHGIAERGIILQAAIGDVFLDADDKMILRFGFFEIVEDRLGHGRGKLFGAKAIATTDDNGITRKAELAGCHRFTDGSAHIKIKRFAKGARLLGAIKDSDALDGFRQGLDKGVEGEWTIQMNLDDADFLALFNQIIDSFLDRVGGGTHDDNDPLGVFRPGVIDQFIFTAGELGELVHLFLYNRDTGRIIRVDGFTPLEVNIGILGGTTHDRAVGGEPAQTVGVHHLVTHHGAHVVKGQFFNFLNFVRGAEAVKEVQKGNARSQGGRLGDQGKVHDFLDIIGTEHRPAGRAAGHDIGMVAKDVQCGRGDGTSGNMKDRGSQFSGDLVHVRDHQQQTLTGRKGRGQCTTLQSAVYGTGRTPLGL